MMNVIPNMIGWNPTSPANYTVSFRLAGSMAAYSFNPTENKTLSEVRIPLLSGGGVLNGSDIVCDIRSDGTTSTTAGSPAYIGADSLGSTATLVNPVWWGNNFGSCLHFSGLSVPVYAGSVYWAVISNRNASTDNFVTVKNMPGILPNYAWGWNTRYSITGGSSWKGTTYAGPFAAALRVIYSDGTREGIPIVSSSNLACVYSGREMGVEFTVPGSINYNVVGGGIFNSRIGTPTGELYYKLYSGTTLLGSTHPINVYRALALTYTPAPFGKTIQLMSGVTYRLMSAETQNNDSASNAWRAQLVTLDVEPGYKDDYLIPYFSGPTNLVLSTDGGATITVCPGSTTPFLLILDSVSGDYTVDAAASTGSTVITNNYIFTIQE